MPRSAYTLAALKRTGWIRILRSPDNDDFISLWSAFSDAAEFKRPTDPAAARVLTLFALISSLHTNDSEFEPAYDLEYAWPFGRTMAVSDAADDQLVFLREAVGVVTHSPMRARMADVLWTVAKREERFGLATMYIDGWIDVLQTQSWDLGMHSTEVNRALEHALRLGKAGRSRVKAVRDLLVAIVLKGGETAETVRLSEILVDHRLAGDDARGIANHLLNVSLSTDSFVRRRYLGIAVELFGLAKLPADRADALAAIVETWITEAKSAVDGNRGHLVAAVQYESALQAL